MIKEKMEINKGRFNRIKSYGSRVSINLRKANLFDFVYYTTYSKALEFFKQCSLYYKLMLPTTLHKLTLLILLMLIFLLNLFMFISLTIFLITTTLTLNITKSTYPNF